MAIIAILASMLLPVLNKARERARSSLCLANMKTLGSCFNFYAEENGDILPAYDTNTTAGRWHQQFAKFIGVPLTASTPKEYWCPSDSSAHRKSKLTRKINDDYPIASYVVNQDNGYIHSNPASGWNRAVKLGKLRNASQYIVMGELGVDGVYLFLWLNEPSKRYLNLACHLNGANYTHADGHVSKLAIPEYERSAAGTSTSRYNINFYPNGIFVSP